MEVEKPRRASAGLPSSLQGVVLWSSGSLVLAHLQILTRQTQLRSRLLLQCSKDLARKCNFRGARSAKTRVSCICLITEASFGLCKADVRWRSVRRGHIKPHNRPARVIRWARQKRVIAKCQQLWLHCLTLQTPGSLSWTALHTEFSVEPSEPESYLAAVTGSCPPFPRPGGRAPGAAWIGGLPLSGRGPAGGCSGAPGLWHSFGIVPEPGLNMAHQWASKKQIWTLGNLTVLSKRVFSQIHQLQRLISSALHSYLMWLLKSQERDVIFFSFPLVKKLDK